MGDILIIHFISADFVDSFNNEVINIVNHYISPGNKFLYDSLVAAFNSGSSTSNQPDSDDETPLKKYIKEYIQKNWMNPQTPKTPIYVNLDAPIDDLSTDINVITDLNSEKDVFVYEYTHDMDEAAGRPSPFVNGVYSVNKAIYDAWSNPLHRGSMWIFSFVDWLSSFDIKIVSKSSTSDVLSNIFDPEVLGWELDLWEENKDSLFWSVILDKKVALDNYENPYTNEWYKNSYAKSQMVRLTLPRYPELSFVEPGIIKDYVLPFTTPLYATLINSVIVEAYSFIFIDLLSYLVCAFVIVQFIMFLFSFYENPNTDESTMDSDYLISAMTVESEEEIASVDDLSLGLYLLVFLFGWYFYMNGSFILSFLPEVAVIFYNLPTLGYLIIFVPLLLLYDFGIFFLSYLRGSSSTLSLMMELLYDYIAIAAFFIRLLVQNVRILLMIFVYFSFYEYVQFYAYMDFAFFNYETFWEFKDYNSSEFSSFYFLLNLANYAIYLIYELLHTFFVVTAQFTAFFAMVFWLFLFLFTMFNFEKHEKFFGEKLEKRKKLFKDLYNNKK